MVIAGVVVVELSMIILSSRYNAVVLARESVNKRKGRIVEFLFPPVQFIYHYTSQVCMA